MFIKKYFPYVTCFITGLVCLIIELVSFRLLAPYFGTSSYVTGIIINTVLLALAVGYYIGGYTADKLKSMTLPYLITLLTSVYLLVFYYLYPVILKSIASFNAIAGSFLAIAAMFFLPMIATAFIPPYLIKMLTSVDNIGKTAGKIYSLSTCGSITGGILTTFVFVPYLGSQKSYMTAIILLVLISIIGLFNNYKYSLLALLIILIPIKLHPITLDEAIYKEESQYNIIKVTKDGNNLYLHLNNFFGYHSKSLDKEMLSGEYYDKFLITPLFTAGKNVLILGNGAGTSMTQLAYFFDLKIDGVEIDSKLTKVGEKFFGLKLDKNKTTIIHNDARYYLNTTEKFYDVIIIDIYAGSPYIPFHLSTVEFFKLVENKLQDDGVIAINFPMYALDTEFETYYINTIQRSFPFTFISDNVIFAFKNHKDITFFNEKIKSYESNKILNKVFAEISEQLKVKPLLNIKPNKRLVFTDDYAPIDNLIFKILKM